MTEGNSSIFKNHSLKYLEMALRTDNIVIGGGLVIKLAKARYAAFFACTLGLAG